MYDKFKSPAVLTAIKVSTLEWLWDIVRMDGEGQ